ncbi:MAG: hypothetical protein Q7N95_08670 [Alphaproteobacteria bacterium]|nr:hypothetical protein [Alphaproteobacteria bacterium]MDP1671108.1 hypothetical protein [Alphaproteobacteria bacterium]
MNSQAPVLESLSWSGDLMKDTFIYRFIDISATLLDLVMENQSVADHYLNWIDDQDDGLDDDQEAAITPLVLSELRNDSGSHILVLGLPTGGQFLVVFQAGEFNAKIILAQDQETATLQAASVTEFTGDLHYAINWGKDFIDRIDEEMIAAGM